MKKRYIVLVILAVLVLVFFLLPQITQKETYTLIKPLPSGPRANSSW
jgi:hypothetical protein